MKLRLTFLTLLILILLYSCNTGANQREIYSADKAIENNKVSDQSNELKIENSIERKIIKHGELRFETANVNQTQSVITKSVTDLGGYISNDNALNSEDRITYRMVLRVPSERFDQLLIKISENVKKFDNKVIDVQDVTEEYIDVESRIKTKKDLENRYKELLVKATTVNEILSIEKEIGNLRTEIESIEGRFKYLKDRISFSTLTVEFYQLTSPPFAFASKLGQALVIGWKWLLGFIIVLIHFWPFILLIGGGIFIAIRFNNKKNKIKNAS